MVEGQPPRRPQASGPSDRPPPGIDRRKLLLGLGFGMANAAVLRHVVGASDPLAGVRVSSASAEADGTAAGPNSTPAPSGPAEPARIDDATPPTEPDHVYDQVVRGGRVIDPDSGYDRVADVGIDGATVAAISETPLTGRTAIDAAGLVVAPGFIDILSYSPNGMGEWWKVADGVTTNLGLHGLDARAADFFGRWDAEGAPVNYGGAYDNAFVRARLGLEPNDTADSATLAQIVEAARTDLADGFVALHLQPEYTPGADTEEVLAHGSLAAELGVPLCLHVRYSDNLEPGTQIEALEEVVRVAGDTGAWVHVEHLPSTGGTGIMPQAIEMLEAARAQGLLISACAYPYTFWATYLRSERFADFQEKFGISYGDLQVAGTPNRLTEATFQAAFADNALTAAYAIPEADVVAALQTPWMMIGSDAILESGFNNHPRASGCFSRVLGAYVRDRGVLSLVDALAKMTILPCRLLEARAPALRRKGRLQIGADADITVFDPSTVADRATIAEPQLPSTGIEWVLVNGVAVKQPATGPDPTDADDRPAGVVTTARSGAAITSDI